MGSPTVTINNLPNEVLEHIFSYVPVEDLALNVQSVCVRWSELCLNSVLWEDSLFSTREDMSDDYVVSVLQKVPKLQWFHTDRNSPAIFCALSDYCKNLRKLVARNTCQGEIKETIKKVFTECIKLEELTIAEVVLLHEELGELMGHWKNLNSLTLIHPSHLPAEMKHIADGCPSLNHLDICATWHYSDLKYFLERKRNQLLSLRIKHATQEDVCVIPLVATCANLRELRLEEDCYKCSLATMSTIKTLSRLTSLRIVIPSLMVDVMENIFKNEALSQLLELELEEGGAIKTTLMHTICRNCPNLLRLRLKVGFELRDDALRDLYMCGKLKELELNICMSLTDAAMEYVSKCTHLKYLTVCKTKIKNWDHLLDLSELKYLSIMGCDVSRLPLEHFPLALKNLRHLTLVQRGNMNFGALDTLQAKMPNLRVNRSTRVFSPVLV